MDETRISQSVKSSLKPVQPGKKPTEAPEQAASTAESAGTAGTLKGKQTARSDFVSIGDTAIKTITDLLPLQVLSSPGLRQMEWAWRQIITDAATQWAYQRAQLSQAYTRLGKVENQVSSVLSQASENVMQSWWQALSVWAGALRRNGSSAAFGRSIAQGLTVPQENYGLLPFSQVSSDTYHRLPTPAQHELLLDRVLSAVTSQNMPQMGSGIFIPQFTDPNRTQEPVRWYAERTARLNRHGQVLDRLSIQFSLHDWPVEIVFLSAKPTLYVHVRSDHPNVHKLASSAQPVLAKRLESGGWRLEQWSISQWLKEDDQ